MPPTLTLVPPLPDRRPGPSASAIPGHPGWCHQHRTDHGGAIATCLGRRHAVTGAGVGAVSQLGAVLYTDTETPAAPVILTDVDGHDGPALTLDGARAYAAILLDLIEQAESTTAVAA